MRARRSSATGGSAAGELLAERGELGVAGEGATAALRLRALARVGVVARLGSSVLARGPTGGVVGRRRLGGLGLLLLGALQLGDVLLVARVGRLVLALPLLALRLVPLAPLAGVRVEALGVDVVAGVVVLGRHAVERRVELGLRGHALVGLLERERDAATVEVDVDDLDHDVVADLHDLLGHLDVALGQLRDVDQALDALVDADERTERHELRDLAGHDLADLVGPGELAPGVLLRRLERQGDPLAVEVDVEDLDRDLLAHLDDLARVVDVLPGQLGDVDQTVDPAEVDERAEVDDRRDLAGANLALLQRLQEGLAHLGLGLLEPGAAGQDHVVAVLVQLDDLRLDLLADVRLQVADP